MGMTAAELAQYNNVGGGMPATPSLGNLLQGAGAGASQATLPAGGTPDVDFTASEIYTGTLAENTVVTLSNPILDKVILLIVDGAFTFTLPGTATVVGGGSYNGAVDNYIYVHCIDATTPAYVVTISQV